MKLVAEVGFDQSFSFLYSRRPGTPAAALPDEVPLEVKQQRLRQLQALLDAQALAISRTHGRQPCSACWWSAPPRKDRASWPAAPRTIAGSIFPARHRCCSDSRT